KQLYYYVIDLLFVFSNDLKGLMEHSNIPKIIDDEAVADYFINSELTSQYLTFFKNVRKLPSAHSLTVSINEIKKKCYWRLEDAPKFNDENIEIYAKKLRILLEEAVHVRMRTIYPTTSHLSGGLDSSSIAVIAARKLRAKNERLTAFNWLHKPIKNSDTNHYEWSNSKTISELENIDFNYISLSSKEIYGYCINESIAYGNTAPFFFAEYPIREAAKNNGSRTIFSGWGGDELASQHANSYYADLFLQGKIKKLFKELKVLVNKRNNKIKGFLGTIYYQILLPQIPKWLYCKMPRSKCFIPFFPFVKNDFLIKIKSIMKNFPIDERLAHKTLKEHSLLLWADGYLQSRIESWSVAGTANRIEYVYPLLDKRIVEFILGVPTECFVDSGMKRYLFRSAVKDLLPKKILLESTKDEINRVEHLYLLLFDASKMFLGNDKIINNKSKYINNEKLKNTLSSMQKLSVKDDVLDEIMVSFQILVMLKELENECQSQEIQ
ncbi:MAG TPA: hypothetical protein ENK66_07550, partial [Arcobacter sp.]|nr:hypothetical protein [Arcobacter sp.]